MLLIPIRIVAVIVGTWFFLPSFALVVYALAEKVWGAAILAALVGLFGAWLLSAGWYGTWSGQPRKADSTKSIGLRRAMK